MFPQICGSWLKSYLVQLYKLCHYILVVAVEPFKLHPMSMSYIYEVFARLLRLWMGICLHTHTITTTDASPDMWELAEILHSSVQTMPLHFGWGCRTFQTVFQVDVIHIWDVWVPSKVADGLMASHSHLTTILWIDLLKRKNCVRLVLHSYLELYGKKFGGRIEHPFFHAPTKLFTVEINMFFILPAKVCCENCS